MMINYKHIIIALSPLIILSGCSGTPQKDIQIKDLDPHTIAFERAKPAVPTRDEAIKNYRSYVKDSSSKENYGTALKRLADLELESSEQANSMSDTQKNAQAKKIMLSSIEHYNTYLQTYPGQGQNDLILYQLAKAYSYNGDFDQALEKMNVIVQQYPETQYIDEVQFRRGEILFVMGDYNGAEDAYSHIIKNSPNSLFYEKSLYKLGWSQFKQSKYIKSLANYFYLLDRKQAEGKILTKGLSSDLSRAETDFINDTLRVISLALSYKKGTETIQLLFTSKTNRNYEPLIYRGLGELYLKKDRHTDAANVFLAYGKKHPLNPLAAEYHTLAIKAFAAGNFHGLVLSTKELFVKKYGVNSSFWIKQNQQGKDDVKKHLVLHIRELANHYHALARKSKKAKDYNKAAVWYTTYLLSFPKDKDAPLMNFLLAETLFDAREYNKALTEYVKTGYDYPEHKKNAEAAYAAILTYDKLLNNARPASINAIKLKAINNSIRFSNTFPENKHAPQVITKTAEDLFAFKRYKLAAEFAKRIIDRKKVKQKKLIKTAWTVYAHSLFELQDYASAELAYIEVLKRTDKKKKLYKDVSDKLAASIYKQGETQRDGGHLELAAFHFLRLGKVIPTSSIRATAEFDAATMQIKLEQWDKATKTLENFNKRFPRHKTYSRGITEKLALTYTNSGKFTKAAAQIAILASIAVTIEDKQKLTWQSAEMYAKAGQTKKANNLYIKYIKQFPKPFAQSIEAHKLVSDYYLNKKQYKEWGKWLKTTIKIEGRGGKKRTDRTNLIAAQATMHLARPLVKRFKQAKLNIPLKKSLKKKKKLMKSALKVYANVIKYQIAEITTESTYYVAEIYHHFADALMQSQRPKGLSGEELEQYDILLEEQAYPFEEKTIDMHTTNIKRTKDGIYDRWIKSSLKALAKLQPIRFSKKEKIENYVSSIN
jgi:TolA-binding protein